MNFKLDLESMINNCPVYYYQENYRFYMDEYPNVEEWDYLPLFDNTIIMKRFLRRN